MIIIRNVAKKNEGNYISLRNLIYKLFVPTGSHGYSYHQKTTLGK